MEASQEERAHSVLTFTVGAGVTRHKGHEVTCALHELAQVLNAQPLEPEGWWSLSRFHEGYVENDSWRSSQGVLVDVDTVPHAPVTFTLEDLRSAARAAGALCPANVVHMSPRGFRLVYVLDAPVDVLAEWDHAAAGAVQLTRAWLGKLGPLAAGLAVDECSEKQAQLFFRPRALVAGQMRDQLAVSTARSAPFTVGELQSAASKQGQLEQVRAAQPAAPAAGATSPKAVPTERTDAYVQRTYENARQRMKAAREGSRNATLNREAYALARMVAGGYLQERALDVLAEDAEKAGLSPDEVQRTMNSALDAAERDGAWATDELPEDKQQPAQRKPRQQEEPEHEEPLRFLTMDELAARVQAKPREWLVPDVLPFGALVLLVGRAKRAGKSTLAWGLLAAAERGATFLGHELPRTGAVVLTEEADHDVDAKRQLFHVRHARVVPRSMRAGATLAQAAAQAVRLALDTGARILLVDTFAWWAELAGDVENTAGSAQALRPLQQAADAGLLVLLVHHTRKNTDGVEGGHAARGSTALTGAVEATLELRAPSNPESHERVLHAETRYSSTQELAVEWDQEPRLLPVVDESGKHVLVDGRPQYRAPEVPPTLKLRGKASRVNGQRAREQMLRWFDSNPGWHTRADVLELCGLRRKEAADELVRLARDGAVQRTGLGQRGNPYRFAAVGTEAEPDPTSPELESMLEKLAQAEKRPLGIMDLLRVRGEEMQRARGLCIPSGGGWMPRGNGEPGRLCRYYRELQAAVAHQRAYLAAREAGKDEAEAERLGNVAGDAAEAAGRLPVEPPAAAPPTCTPEELQAQAELEAGRAARRTAPGGA